MRRYVTDAGELLPAAQAGPFRLHDAKSAEGGAARRGLRRLGGADRPAPAEEDLARVRPDLDGHEIMRLLNVPPGPVVGRAWRYLKELRLEHGPLGKEKAEQALLEWARAEGVLRDE